MPSAYEEQFPNYDDYLATQLVPGHKFDDVSIFKAHLAYVTYFIGLTKIQNKARILDLGCNTGHGLRAWNSVGFSDLWGADLSTKNIEVCQAHTPFIFFPVDAHNMSIFYNTVFDVVYATHVLEHMYSPTKVVLECKRILSQNGHLLVVLPYPDGDSPGHLGSVELGTCQAKNMAHSQPYDDGVSVTEFFKKNGFSLIAKKYDSVREPEIWLLLRKDNQ